MLRSSATTHFWNCAQVRQLLQLITFRQRVDAVVMLFRRIVDLDSSFYAAIYTALKPGECAALRSRLGAPVLRLLPQEEEEPPADEGDTAVVFLTETDGGGDGGEGGAADGGEGGAAQVMSLDEQEGVQEGSPGEGGGAGETQTGGEGDAPPVDGGEAAAEGGGGGAPAEGEGEVDKALPEQA
eukprot:3225096-Prymnesium_polylepis.1